MAEPMWPKTKEIKKIKDYRVDDFQGIETIEGKELSAEPPSAEDNLIKFPGRTNKPPEQITIKEREIINTIKSLTGELYNFWRKKEKITAYKEKIKKIKNDWESLRKQIPSEELGDKETAGTAREIDAQRKADRLENFLREQVPLYQAAEKNFETDYQQKIKEINAYLGRKDVADFIAKFNLLSNFEKNHFPEETEKTILTIKQAITKQNLDEPTPLEKVLEEIKELKELAIKQQQAKEQIMLDDTKPIPHQKKLLSETDQKLETLANEMREAQKKATQLNPPSTIKKTLNFFKKVIGQK